MITPKDKVNLLYMGCFNDNQTIKDLSLSSYYSNSMNIAFCLYNCEFKGYLYAGLRSK